MARRVWVGSGLGLAFSWLVLGGATIRGVGGISPEGKLLVPKFCAFSLLIHGWISPTGFVTNLATAGVIVPDCIICRLFWCSGLSLAKIVTFPITIDVGKK